MNKSIKDWGMEHKKNIIRTIVIGLTITVFFIGIVYFYYRMVCNEKTEGIIKDGKFFALQSSNHFDKYLSTNIDLIKFTAYTLDGMISEGKSDEEIQGYLAGQSTAIRNAVLENYTGLYGYINGRFFSGTYWEPPADYVATERPWYTRPMEYPGEITILEPYVDVQSGNTMLALGKTLCDGVSVISVDVSLDQMQKLTEEAVTDGSADIEMILTGDGTVVTHSDINEVGMNYLDAKGSLGNLIASKIYSSDEGYFTIQYGGKDYLVYDVVFHDTWHCISVHDETKLFESINNIMVGTVIIIILSTLVIAYFLAVNGKRRYITERAVASNEAKTAFLSNMSHEIRTPINAILGMNEMILRDSRDKTVLEYSGNVKKAGQTLLGLVNDILDFSKIEAGKMELVPALYSVPQMLTDLVNMFSIKAADKNIEFKTDFDKGLPKDLFGDEVRIKQIIMNLLSNAVKYTEKGLVLFKVSYEDIAESDEFIVLNVSVKDSGIGIKAEDIDKLFSEFERIEEKRNRHIEGTGLGMNITKRLLEMMGSNLRVDSVYGEGSVFSFSLKQRVINREPVGDFTSDKSAVKKEFLSKTRESFIAPYVNILVVDDNPMNLTVCKSLLRETKMQIDTASGGDEALGLVKSRKYDVILLDHMMPVKDGIETLHELRKMSDNPNSNMPCICLTANAVSGARDYYLSEGFDEYLTKPVDAVKLEKLLMRFISPEKYEKVVISDESDDTPDIPTEFNDLNDSGLIDVATGIKNSGTVSAYIPLLKIFYNSINEKAEELAEYYRLKDIKNYTIKIHALKSSARIIGALNLGEKAFALEKAGKENDFDFIQNNHGNFISEFKSLAEPLGSLFETIQQKEDDESKAVADEDLMNDVYEEIRTAADDMDCERLKEIFDEMNGFIIPENDRKVWKEIKEASDNYDYFKITEIVDGRN